MTGPTAPEAKTSAAYATIASKDGDSLTKASVPADIAGMVTLHETTESMSSGDGMETDDAAMDSMKGMKAVPSIKVPAGGSVELKPGGYHIMLEQLKGPITAGQKIPLTLTFAKAGTVEVDAIAREG